MEKRVNLKTSNYILFCGLLSLLLLTLTGCISKNTDQINEIMVTPTAIITTFPSMVGESTPIVKETEKPQENKGNKTKGSPPLPIVVSMNTKVPVSQSSYCWGNLGCADYVGGKLMLKGEIPTIVTSEANIKISFDYKPGPTELNVQQLQENKIIEVPLKDGYITAPKENGVYYYNISAFWKTDDGKFSTGDTSSVFVIEVK
jgi:hypothetical protein